jgi:hypothetical protein
MNKMAGQEQELWTVWLSHFLHSLNLVNLSKIQWR